MIPVTLPVPVSLALRFSGKAVDTAAGKTVDYAAQALPLLVALLGGALGIPVG